MPPSASASWRGVQVDGDHPAQADVDGGHPAEDAPHRVGDVVGAEPGRGDLVEEGLKGVEVVGVDDDHIDRHPPQRPGQGEAAEAGPDDHHPWPPARKGRGVRRVARWPAGQRYDRQRSAERADRLDEQVGDRHALQQVLPEGGLGLGHRVLQRPEAAVVPGERGAQHGHRQPLGEAYVQQRDAGGLAVLDLGHDHDQAPVRTAPGHQHPALGRHLVLGAPQAGVRLGAQGQVEGDAAPVDDRDGGLGVAGPALDAVAGVAGDLGHGRRQGAQRAQDVVGQPVPGGAGAHDGLDQRRLEQALVGAGDAHGDRLGLVLDGVDRPGELVDALGEGPGQVVEDHGRGADLAELQLVRLEGQDAQAVAQQRRQPGRRGGLQLTVVGPGPQAVEERPHDRLEAEAQPVAHVEALVGGDGAARPRPGPGAAGNARASMARAAS